MPFRQRAPSPDEVVLRKTVSGICNSRKCNGTERTATKTVYGDHTVLVRCETCKSKDDFVEDTHNFNAPGWKLGESDPQEESDFVSDRYQRRKGRKGQ
jgi:hypothetical protein